MFNPSQSPNFSYVPPESPSPNIRTLLAYREAFNEWNLDKMAAVFDDSLEHHILPKRPEQKAIFIGSSIGESATGSPYTNEYMLIIHFTPPAEGSDGLPKMSLVKEFVDSGTVLKFFTEERAKADKAAAAGIAESA
ncbi:hypothetical protein FPV67DRAFT_1668238 [Lyophyllum atratum]|nr:hypothetical protein FPV67DRAFT_1668238 [Lyophyllum atratum]